MAEKKERELPEVLELDFTICDESVNRYHWRLLVEGIDLTGFLLNPVCCVQHEMGLVSIGKWKNLHTEDGKLLGTLEFDRNDEIAVMYYWKYKDGYMNAVSLHIIPVEESEDTELLLPGQRYPTITKSEMLEISVVTVPGQKYAVKLSTPEGDEYKLSLLIQLNTNSKMAKEDTNVEQLQAQLAEQRKLNAENLVKLHKQRGVVTDGEVEHLQKLALADYDSVGKMLEARPTPEAPKEKETEKPESKTGDQNQLTDELKNLTQGFQNQKTGKTGTNERDNWTYLDYYKKDVKALDLMRKNEPDKYKELEASFYAESETMGIKTTNEE